MSLFTNLLLVLSFSTSVMQAMQPNTNQPAMPSDAELEIMLNETISLECSICLDPFFGSHDKKKMYTTHCGHCFHVGCLSSRLKLSNLHCPFCKKNLSNLIDKTKALLSIIRFNPDQTSALEAIEKLLSEGLLIDLYPVQHLPEDKKNLWSGVTPLVIAATFGKTAIIQRLIKAGANVNARTPDQGTCLHEILHPKNHIPDETVLALIDIFAQAGIDLSVKTDSKDGECTALFYAAQSRSTIIVRKLISVGARIDTKNKLGMTLLHAAAKCGNTAVVEMLLDEYGFSVNDGGNTNDTPLHCSALRNHMETARSLLNRGASKTLRNTEGHTPQDLATIKGHHDLAQLLA